LSPKTEMSSSVTGKSSRKNRRRQAPAVFAFVLAAALIGYPGAASATSQVPQAGDSARTAAQVVAYWTPQRMKQAQSASLIEVDASQDQGAEAPVPQAGPLIPFTSGEQVDTLSFPNRVHGRVFFTDPVSGGNYACSGTAVDAPNRSTVITAGHCVDLSGAWNTNFAFVPGYKSGSSPYGVWAASDESAPSGWTQSGSFRYDVGAAVMALNSNGQALEDVVGARGILFNQPISGAVRSYGYPAQAPFNGSKLWACDSTLGYTDPAFPGSPPTLGIGCDMTGGSSGGGWVITDGSGNGYVNGVNSYKYSSQPNVMYGPYFGDAAQSLYTSLSTEAPGTPGSPASGSGTPPQAAAPAPLTVPQQKCFKKRKKHGKKRKRVCRPI
jgi:V8-like Glu-specific endopeptidase